MPSVGAKGPKRKSVLFNVVAVVLSAAVVVLLVTAMIAHFSVNNGRITGAKTLKNLSGGFSCTVDLTVSGKEYEVNLVDSPKGDCTMTFQKPDDLRSLSFEKGESGMKVKFGQLEAAVDAASIPQSSYFSAVTSVFAACGESGIKAKSSGSDTVLYGGTQAGDFTLTLDKSLKPKSFTLPAMNMTAVFKNFKYGA